MKRRSSWGISTLALALLGAVNWATPADAGTDLLGYQQTGLVGYVNAVAAAPNGGVYVAGQSGIARVAPDGKTAQRFLDLENAHGVAVDAGGDVYVSPDNPSGPGGVSKYSPSGALLWHAMPDLHNALDYGSLSVAHGVVWFTTWDMAYGLDASDGRLLHSFSVSKAQEIVALPSGNVLVGHNRITGGLTEYTSSGAAVRSIPEFSLDFTVDAGGTIIGNEYRSDGSLQTRVIALAPSGDVRYAPLRNQEAMFMDYAVDSTGVVWGAMVPSSAGAPQLIRLDPATPDAALTGATYATAGQAAAYDATASTVPFGQVTRYEWDLDEDGIFELDTGSDGTIEHTYLAGASGQQNRVVTVRVTSDRGGAATAQLAVTVWSPTTSTPGPAPTPPPTSGPAEPAPVPSPGPVGVSINGGDQYTNDPKVTIVARWPLGYRRVMISNDGGFVPNVQGTVEDKIQWTLESSGPERLPKTVYVRFLDGSRVSETYQDDIILDQTKPMITAGSAVSARVGARTLAPRLSQAALRQYTVTTKASDRTSGVRKMQITGNKKRPGKWVAYKKTRSYRTSSSRIFIRVRDGAGNVSGWKRLR